ncbi:MAG: hypothetical protein Unbinned5784contig1000_33 [Prokaryotic dsDNA virus sp.]|nr:MAG: hypothetical protein Unbinned5784contig1000_33 [Prokaryotic dsDNA virus sp.]
MNNPLYESDFDEGYFDTAPQQQITPFGSEAPMEQGSDGWFVDSVKGVGRGVAGAVESIAELPTLLPGVDYDIEDNFGLGHSTTAVGSMVEGTTQFLTGFLPGGFGIGHLGKLGKAAKIAKSASSSSKKLKAAHILARAAKMSGKERQLKAATYGKSMAVGALADFAVFAEDEERLSNMLQGIPGLEENMVLEFLAQDEEDSAIESRLKNVLEGAGVGLMVDGVINVLKGLRNRSKILTDVTKTDAERRQALEDNEAYIEDEAARGLEDSGPSDFAIDREADEVRGEAADAPPEVEVEAPKTLAEEFPDLATGDYRFLQREAKERGIKANQGTAALQEQIAAARRQEAIDGPKTRADEMDTDWQKYEADLVERYGSVDEAPQGKRNALKAKRNKAARRRTAERIAGVGAEKVGGLTPFQVRVRDLAEETVAHGSLDQEGAVRLVEEIEIARESGEDFLEKIAGVVNTATLSSKANRMMALIYSQTSKIDNAVDHLGNPIPKGKSFDELTSNEASIRMWADMWGRKPEEVAVWMQRTAASIGEDSLNVQGFLKYTDNHLDHLEELHRAARSGDPEVLAKLGMDQNQAVVAFGKAYEEAAQLLKGFGSMRRETGRALRRFHTRASSIMTPEFLEMNIKEMGGRDWILEQGDKLFATRGINGKNNAAALKRLAAFDRKARMTFMLNEYFVNMVLSSIRTMSTNTLGNLATTVYGPLEALMGARIKQGIGTLKGQNVDDMALEVTRALDELMQLVPQFSTAAKWGKKAWKQKDYILDQGHGVQDLPEHMKDAWGADNLGFVTGRDLDPAKGIGLAVERFGNVLRLPSRALMATDEFYKQWNYRSAVAADLMFEGRKKVKSGEIDNLDEWVDKELHNLTRRGQAFTEKNLQIEAARRFKTDDPKYAHALGWEEMEVDKEQWIKKQKGDPEVLNRGAIGERAVEKARLRTFTNDLDPDNGFLSSLGSTMQKFGNQHPLFRLFVPFIRTPMNILLYAGRRTALPVVNKDLGGAAEYLFKTSFGNKSLDTLKSKMARELASKDPRVRAEAAGRMMSTLGFSATFFAAASAGNITGAGPKDKDQRAMMTQAGWQPYSLKVGDTYVSYQKMDPFATIAGVFADMFDAARYAPEGDQGAIESIITATTVSLAHNIQSKSYLQGLVQATGIISDPEKSIPRAGGRLLSALTVPALIASTRDLADPNMLEVRGMVDQMIARVPMLGSAMLDPQRTVLGEPVNKKTFEGASRTTADMGGVFLPLLINSSTDDEVHAELAALAYPFSNPPVSKFGTDLSEHKNSKGQSAYDRWMELTGSLTLGGKTKRGVRSALKRLFNSAGYQRLPVDGISELDQDSPRVREITKILSRYRAVALRQMLSEFPEVAAQARNQMIANQSMRSGVDTSIIRNQLFPME